MSALLQLERRTTCTLELLLCDVLGSTLVRFEIHLIWPTERKFIHDSVVGFLLAGVDNVDLRRKTNYLIVDSKTTVKQIEDAFKEFTAREDIAVVLISQYVSFFLFLVDSYNKPVPAILEIPSKDHRYDPAHDSVLSRVKYLFSVESVASDRR
ncbi:hypothetical protein TIFTF001_018053 [Ficus carica]|uniref:V-type proton ATPase subunit F n=1 Tax=Ficus carica TaxID=3494 RepID=A0AA88AV59_FICCA|nr:hypothetical protein TIFTF001_018053 [Ficus carica]